MSNTEKYIPPKYVVEPAKNDKGFFLFKAEFEKLKGSKEKDKKKFTPGISWRFADEK